MRPLLETTSIVLLCGVLAIACTDGAFQGLTGKKKTSFSGDRTPAKPDKDAKPKDDDSSDADGSTAAPTPGKNDADGDAEGFDVDGDGEIGGDELFISPITFDCSAGDKTIYVGEEGDIPEDATGLVRPYDTKVEIVAEGSFCPNANRQKSVHLSFIVDVSGSMLEQPFNNRTIPKGGSDPRKNGSCGRLEAVKTLINNVLDEAGDTSVKVSLVTFSSNVVKNIGFIDPNAEGPNGSFIDTIEQAGLCEGKGFTNYKAGLDAAYEHLQGIKGSKAVYFITDGAPRYTLWKFPDQEAEQDAITSAKRFFEVDGLTFNSVFLGSKTDDKGNTARGWKRLKENITPDDYENVTLTHVEQAGDLKAALETLESPLAVDSAEGVFQVSGLDDESITVNLKDEDGNSGTIPYSTDPLLLKGLEGEWVDNIFSLTATSVTGEDLSTTLTIKYCKIGPCQ